MFHVLDGNVAEGQGYLDQLVRLLQGTANPILTITPTPTPTHNPDANYLAWSQEPSAGPALSLLGLRVGLGLGLAPESGSGSDAGAMKEPTSQVDPYTSALWAAVTGGMRLSLECSRMVEASIGV